MCFQLQEVQKQITGDGCGSVVGGLDREEALGGPSGTLESGSALENLHQEYTSDVYTSP